MMRGATILWGVLAAVAGTSLFMLKYEVQAQEQRLASLHKDIADTEESIHVLKAEWSYLNDPVRLREQAERHLGLHPLKPGQISTIASLPMADPQPTVSDQQPGLVEAQPAPRPAPVAVTPAPSAEARKSLDHTGKAVPAPSSQPTKPARAVTALKTPTAAAAKPAATKPIAAKPAGHFQAKPAAVASAQPKPAVHPVAVMPVYTSAANVTVIKSPALAEPEMASTRARP